MWTSGTGSKLPITGHVAFQIITTFKDHGLLEPLSETIPKRSSWLRFQNGMRLLFSLSPRSKLLKGASSTLIVGKVSNGFLLTFFNPFFGNLWCFLAYNNLKDHGYQHIMEGSWNHAKKFIPKFGAKAEYLDGYLASFLWRRCHDGKDLFSQLLNDTILMLESFYHFYLFSKF